MLFVLFFIRAIGILPVMHTLIAELFQLKLEHSLLELLNQ